MASNGRHLSYSRPETPFISLPYRPHSPGKRDRARTRTGMRGQRTQFCRIRHIREAYRPDAHPLQKPLKIDVLRERKSTAQSLDIQRLSGGYVTGLVGPLSDCERAFAGVSSSDEAAGSAHFPNQTLHPRMQQILAKPEHEMCA